MKHPMYQLCQQAPSSCRDGAHCDGGVMLRSVPFPVALAEEIDVFDNAGVGALNVVARPATHQFQPTTQPAAAGAACCQEPTP